jgi:sugar phosphate isomerase/epimerase
MTICSLPLSYCTNVHPARTVDEIISGLSVHASTARQILDVPMAAGLWLPASAARELTEHPAELERLAQMLWQSDLSCYTLNAFPYGDFHSERVKEQVYLPDWSTPERAEYTEQCASLLAQLLPNHGEGTISTLPLGGRMNERANARSFHAECCSRLIRFAVFLKELHEKTGRKIRLAIEPEPFCELDMTTERTIPIFTSLFEMAEARGCEDTVREYIGLCLDVCHQAVVFEDISRSIDEIEDLGIRINKVHITNAVELLQPSENAEGRAALRRFVEPRYLHQTYARFSDGRIAYREDLLLQDLEDSPGDRFQQAEAWRVHFHVPVYAEKLGPLNTTRRDLIAALRRIVALDYSPQLEVETYTWPVMPGQDSTADDRLAARIARELGSTYELLSALDPGE